MRKRPVNRAKKIFHEAVTGPNSTEDLQVEKMPHAGLTEDACEQPLFKVTIRPSKAVMLADVFRPGTHDKCFDKTVRGLKVAANSPSRRAVAAPDAADLSHSLDKFRYVLGTHVVLNRDQDRTGFTIRSDDRRQAPMIPRRQIDAHVP